MYEKWQLVNGTWTINLKELSEVEWMNSDFLFKDAWLRLIDWLYQLMMNLKRNEFLNFSFRVFLNRLHLMVPVVMVGVSVHQEFPASQEALDPRD